MKQGTIVLHGQRVTLRRYAEGDGTTLHEKLGCDPDMMRFTGWNPYFSPESAERLVAETIEGYAAGSDEYSWVIEVDGTPVGILGGYDFDATANSIEIGYSVFKEHWGHGYASEALALACDHLLKTESLSRLIAWSAADNIGSTTVLTRVGFVQTKTKEAALNVEGETYDQVFFEKA